tara:strand:- start:1974 stop:3260 length:1287 start_codon:yes stop_codon:yes gene_type:complete
MNLKETLSYALDKLLDAGMNHVEGGINEYEKKELNIESGKMSLFRTTFSNSISLEAIKDLKQSSISVNKIDKKSVDIAITSLIESVNSSQVDEANAISENQTNEIFSKGQLVPDLDLMYDRVEDFNKHVKNDYKKIILEAVTLDHNTSKTYIANSNGVDYEVNKGLYGFSAMFTAKDGSNTSSFNYTGVNRLKLDNDFKNQGYISDLMRQSEEQIKSFPIKNKFVGQVIVTPHCLPDFVSFIDSSISDSSLISGTSIYKNKIGDKITSDIFSLSSNPIDDRIDSGYFLTGDTYKAKNTDIVKKGVLNTHLLSLYGAKKTGGKRVSNQGGCYIVNTGSESLENMIKNIDKGILLCRFSGGSPSDNGDFSGVAKNSYYIEKGKIKFPIIETMVSGNIAQMFMNINSISKESVDFGDSILPWVSFDGVTVS